ncbi:MAG: hypothetical protein QME81_10520 [bacterium]|nr:hypothetical protein [bacterium]
MRFSDSVKEKIFKYTTGHLFQIHSLGSSLYDNQKSGKVTNREWKKGFYEGLLYLGNIVYEGIIHNLSDNEIKLIRRIEPFKKLRIKDFGDLKMNGIRTYFSRLTEKNVLKSIRYGEYEVKDKLLVEYLKMFC